MRINPNSWKFFFKKEEIVLAIPSWNMPRVYLPSRSVRQRWMDAGAFYPALRLRSKAVRFGFQFLSAFCPCLFEKKKTGLVSRGSPGLFRRLVAASVQRLRILRHSALFQALVPEAYGLTGEQAPVNDDFAYGLEEWAEMLDGFDHAVVMVGAAADEKQKLIIRMEDQQQRILAFMKYAEQPIALQKVENEKQVLSALAPGLGPKVLKFDRCRDGSALLMTAVQGRPLPAQMPGPCGPRGVEGIQRFLKRLETGTTINVDEHPAIVRIRKEVAEIRGQRSEISDQRSGVVPDIRHPTSDFLDNLLEPLRKQRWPVVIQHGDFTPWNILRVSESGVRREDLSVKQGLKPNHLKLKTSDSFRLCAIDWEDGEIEGFPGFDMVYICIQTGYFLHHWPAEKVLKEAAKALLGDLSPEQRVSVVKLGALDSWVRGIEDGMTNTHPLQQFRRSIVNIKI